MCVYEIERVVKSAIVSLFRFKNPKEVKYRLQLTTK